MHQHQPCIPLVLPFLFLFLPASWARERRRIAENPVFPRRTRVEFAEFPLACIPMLYLISTRSTPRISATSSCTASLGTSCTTSTPFASELIQRPRYDRSWGVLFESFDEFLAFSWPVIVVTDAWTGRAHIVTRMTSIGAFLKMVKTRYCHGALTLGLNSPLTK